MKLLAPDTGWSQQQDGRLYWTSDDGQHWEDITPRVSGEAPSTASISLVFFRDSLEGWALLAGETDDDEPTYWMAHTSDRGEHWSLSRFTYPKLPEWLSSALAGPSDMFFVDRLHGWINMAFAGNSKPGRLLATEDGGATWRWVHSPGSAGPIYFLSNQDGWLLATGFKDALFVTHDGCNTWQEVHLPQPPGATTPGRRMGYLPVFRDRQHGVFAAYDVFGPEAPSNMVLYSTDDGGHAWQLARVLAEARDTDEVPFGVAGSNVVVSTTERGAMFTMASVPLAATTNVDVHPAGANAFSFVDAQRGWARVSGGLMSTKDGGATWTRISPEVKQSAP